MRERADLSMVLEACSCSVPCPSACCSGNQPSNVSPPFPSAPPPSALRSYEYPFALTTLPTELTQWESTMHDTYIHPILPTS